MERYELIEYVSQYISDSKEFKSVYLNKQILKIISKINSEKDLDIEKYYKNIKRFINLLYGR